MISILIVGAGKSSTYLIDYLLNNTIKRVNPWEVIVADNDEQNLIQKTKNFPKAKIVVLDINNKAQRENLVKNADLVVSLMPPHLHILLAKDCLQFKKNLITSSYASDEMRELDSAAKKAGLMFMCEMGLDPGIDHMTASSIFSGIRKVASQIIGFKSYCGGLIAHVSDDNPWHYKFSWNPKNLINAGKDGARFLKNGQTVNIPYSSIFYQNDIVHCQGVGDLAYYGNRDSLSYIDIYDLHECEDFLRATLRHPAFCKGWDVLIKMGLTDSELNLDKNLTTYQELVKSCVGYDDSSIALEEFTWKKFGVADKQTQEMVKWLGLFENQPLLKDVKTAGDALLNILLDKWAMKPEDKDMVVMMHEVEYAHKFGKTKLTSTMVVEGEDAQFSAMAKTVGMPIAILAELILGKKIKHPTGVLIPTMPEVYRPVLGRLEKFGVVFSENIESI